MQTEMLDKTIEVRDQFVTGIERLKESVTEAVEDEISAAKRVIKQGRHAAEDLIDDAESQVKRHPSSALGVSFGIGFGLGTVIGLLLARNRHCRG